MPETNLSTNLGKVIAIDAVDQFGTRVNSFFKLLGNFNKVALPAGSVVNTYTTTITKPEGGNVAPGAVIPLTKVDRELAGTHELVLIKDRVAVTAEDIQKYGTEQAVAKVNRGVIADAQKSIRNSMIESLAEGEGKAEGVGFQQAIANATAEVRVVFEDDDPSVISFVHPRDVAKYLGDANITTQNAFGLTYMENFMDNRFIFQSSVVPEGTIYSTSIDNLNLYYVDMRNGDLANEFDLEVDESGLIGIRNDINTARATKETLVMYSILMLPERLDGVVVGTINEAEGDVTP